MISYMIRKKTTLLKLCQSLNPVYKCLLIVLLTLESISKCIEVVSHLRAENKSKKEEK